MNPDERDLGPSKRTIWKGGRFWSALLVGSALFCSGFSGLTNEVLWQHSLKRILGGSETLGSTIVVSVFLVGIGAGAWIMARLARRVRDPLMGFVALEAGLALVNIGVCRVLDSGFTETVLAIQAGALESGVPLPVLYALGAAAILMVPCLLMGATLPLASEVCQRSLLQTEARILGLVFFVNTFGAMAGCVLGTTFLVPQLGLRSSMMLAASLNGLAALLLLGLRRFLPRGVEPKPIVSPKNEIGGGWRPSRTEVLAFGLGCAALAYEMLLFRIYSLTLEPLPTTFSMVLSGFLLYWSVGAALGSRRIRIPLGLGLGLTGFFTALGLAGSILVPYTEFHGALALLGFVLSHPGPFLPCLLFGFLFTRIVASQPTDWGRGVGRIYGWNTLGACTGILLMVFVGYSLHLYLAMGLSTALCIWTALFYLDGVSNPKGRVFGLLGAVLVVLCVSGPRWIDSADWSLGRVIDPWGDTRFYFGRSGVVGVADDGSVYWNGLWHSELVESHSDAVDTNNWWMAVAPVMAHSTGDIRNVALVGLGTGITAGTLSRSNSIERIDAYELNHTLAELYASHPVGTMQVATDPKIRTYWQDARSGLALREQRYDIITTAPLYLHQTGSALLNSRETYELIRSRLRPGGVVCIFAWGSDAQALTVRQTAASVFEYHESIWGGYLLLLSDSPLSLDAQSIESRMRAHASDPLWADLIDFAGPGGGEALATLVDDPGFGWGDGRLVSTDDRPIIEYPWILEHRVDALGYDRDAIRLPEIGEWSRQFYRRW